MWTDVARSGILLYSRTASYWKMYADISFHLPGVWQNCAKRILSKSGNKLKITMTSETKVVAEVELWECRNQDRSGLPRGQTQTWKATRPPSLVLPASARWGSFVRQETGSPFCYRSKRDCIALHPIWKKNPCKDPVVLRVACSLLGPKVSVPSEPWN